MFLGVTFVLSLNIDGILLCVLRCNTKFQEMLTAAVVYLYHIDILRLFILEVVVVVAL